MDTPKQATPKQANLFARIRNNSLTTTFILLATLSAGILAGSVFTSPVSGKQQSVDSSDARPLVIPNPRDLSTGFAKIAKEVGPAVVNINTETIPKQSNAKRPQQRRRATPLTPTPPGGGGGDDADPNQGDMQDFFNRFFGGQNPDGGDDEGGGKREALGSGFIVDPRGYIITNNHVVDKADRIFVKLSTDPENPDDKGRPAKVVGVDPDTDIAVIKIEPEKTPYPVAKLGNSDGAQVGDWVLAIGEPFGLSKTVSAGIVSAKDRSIDDNSNGKPNQFQKFIQTDAAINPGNSGGPLVDMAGEVIGMNTAIYTQSMGSEGVGFAMPSNVLANVYNMLIGPEHKVIRGSIGISFQSAVSPAAARMYGLANGGVLVGTVTPGKGADKAGIKPYDVIVSIDGKPIKDGDALVAEISARKVGSTVQLGYLRDGKQHTASVAIGDRSQLEASSGNPGDENGGAVEADAGEGKLGITVTAVPADTVSKLGLKGGVQIATIRPGSFADDIRLSKGAIILEINKKPVTDEASYRSIVSGLKSGDDVVFVVRSGTPGAPAGNNLFGGTLP